MTTDYANLGDDRLLFSPAYRFARRRSATDRRRRVSARVLAWIIGPLAALLFIALVVANVATEAMWFGALGFGSVFTTVWFVRVFLFFVGFLLMGGAVFASFTIAYRAQHTYSAVELELGNSLDDSLDNSLDNSAERRTQKAALRVRNSLDPLRRTMMFSVPLVLGVIGGFAVASSWQTVLLVQNAVPFGIPDPQFGLDVGFYVFQLPFFRFALDFIRITTAMAGIAALLLHYMYGAIQFGKLPDGVPHMTAAARRQIGVLAALFLLTMAGSYWLSRYELLNAPGVKFDGAAYTAIHALLPGRTILAIIAVLVAVVVFACLLRQSYLIALIATGLLVLSAIVLGTIYPAIVQRFQVNPNAQVLEEPYIQRNIDATLFAYGMSSLRLETTQFEPVVTADSATIRQDAETTASIRLLDPAIVAPSFRQLQQNKQYYDFPNQLAVDRYLINGESRDTVIAARELNLAGLGLAQRNWVNDHTVFTHGYGVVAAYGNQVGADGRPAFFEGGIPTAGLLTDTQAYEPRIYFSPRHYEYSVVGVPDGTIPWELDYQTDDAFGGTQVNNAFPTLEVTGGPTIGTLWRKMLFALRFGDEQLLFSDRVTPVSQILFTRDPATRVAKVAPWLTLDDRVYPAVVDGRVKWIVDGYTTSESFPYSQATDLPLPAALANGDGGPYGNRGRQNTNLLPQQVNYLRNSVKATVDAYDGSVTLYAWEPADPLLRAWTRIFPNTIHRMSEISGDLMSHLRYPEDLFEVQRGLLTRYHVQDAAAFFSGQDFWQIPEDPTDSGTENRPLQPPYYLTLKMPGQSEPTFSLTSAFVPGGNSDRQILTGFLAADAEAGSVAGVRSLDYGVLRLLVMPRGVTVPGPGQVQTNFVTNPLISQQLNVLEIGSSEVIRGNQLTLPVGGGLLYVQPIYVQSAMGTQFPFLRKILVAFGDSVGFADTLSGALDQVFGDAGELPVFDDSVPPGEVPGQVPGPALGPDAAAPPGVVLPPVAALPPVVGTGPDAGLPPGAGAGPDAGIQPGTATPPSVIGSPNPIAPSANPSADLTAALADADLAWAESEAALQVGDFAAYGAAQSRLREAIERAIVANNALSGISQPVGD